MQVSLSLFQENEFFCWETFLHLTPNPLLYLLLICQTCLDVFEFKQQTQLKSIARGPWASARPAQPV